MKQELETYPASKRSEIFELMHESQNWLQVEHDGWKLPATKDAKEDCGKWQTKDVLMFKHIKILSILVECT